MAYNYNSFMGFLPWLASQRSVYVKSNDDNIVTEDIDFEVVEHKLLTYNPDVPSVIFDKNKDLQDKLNKLK